MTAARVYRLFLPLSGVISRMQTKGRLARSAIWARHPPILIVRSLSHRQDVPPFFSIGRWRRFEFWNGNGREGFLWVFRGGRRLKRSIVGLKSSALLSAAEKDKNGNRNWQKCSMMSSALNLSEKNENPIQSQRKYQDFEDYQNTKILNSTIRILVYENFRMQFGIKIATKMKIRCEKIVVCFFRIDRFPMYDDILKLGSAHT